ncbi:MAG: hypothetical protein OXN18_04140 [Gemmatimonadota bacterium]|nr:hypothetical protein [Gemmatimonadota bacterium]
MTLRSTAIIAGCTLAAFARTAPPLQGQETVEITTDDLFIEADFEELYRVGSMQGDGWDVFGRVGGVAFDGSGNLYVLDTQAARFSVVGLDGNLLRQFGRLGEGPGEFGGDTSSAISFAVLHDGRVTAFDPSRGHFVMFSPEGEFQRQFRLAASAWVIIPALQAESASAAVVSTGEVGYLGSAPDSDGPSLRHVMRYGMTGDEVSVDTVAAVWAPREDLEFAPQLSVGVLPDGSVAFVDSSAYAVKVTGPAGGVSRVLRRPFPAVPVTETMRTRHVERELEDLEAMSNRGNARQQAMAEFLRAQLESAEFYHEIPLVRSIQTSPEGTIWVRRSGPEPGRNGPIDLLTADGRYLGSFASDATSLPSAFGPDGLVAFVRRNDLDVQTVVVSRLPKEIR